MCKFLDWLFDCALPNIKGIVIITIKWACCHLIMLWYLVLLVISTWFVVKNFNCVTTFIFFKQFNGKNLIFILWLILLLLPLVKSFEGFGVKVKFNDGYFSKSSQDAVDGLLIANDKEELRKKEAELEKAYNSTKEEE